MNATTKMNRLPRATLSSQVGERIREAILSGALPLGSQLNEMELAEQFGVSRGPLREAMQRLIQEGLLYSEPHRGVFVLKLSAEDFADIDFVRHAIEGAAIRRILSSKHLPEIHKSLSSIAMNMEKAAARKDWSRVAELHMAFHSELISAAGSFRLSRAHATLQAETRLCMHMLISSYRSNPALVKDHQRLADSLAAGKIGAGHIEPHHHHFNDSSSGAEPDAEHGHPPGSDVAA